MNCTTQIVQRQAGPSEVAFQSSFPPRVCHGRMGWALVSIRFRRAFAAAAPRNGLRQSAPWRVVSRAAAAHRRAACARERCPARRVARAPIPAEVLEFQPETPYAFPTLLSRAL